MFDLTYFKRVPGFAAPLLANLLSTDQPGRFKKPFNLYDLRKGRFSKCFTNTEIAKHGKSAAQVLHIVRNLAKKKLVCYKEISPDKHRITFAFWFPVLVSIKGVFVVTPMSFYPWEADKRIAKLLLKPSQEGPIIYSATIFSELNPTEEKAGFAYVTNKKVLSTLFNESNMTEALVGDEQVFIYNFKNVMSELSSSYPPVVYALSYFRFFIGRSPYINLYTTYISLYTALSTDKDSNQKNSTTTTPSTQIGFEEKPFFYVLGSSSNLNFDLSYSREVNLPKVKKPLSVVDDNPEGTRLLAHAYAEATGFGVPPLHGRHRSGFSNLRRRLEIVSEESGKSLKEVFKDYFYFLLQYCNKAERVRELSWWYSVWAWSSYEEIRDRQQPLYFGHDDFGYSDLSLSR